MKCEQISEFLEAYALDALEAEERQMVEQHLATCQECRRLLDEYHEVVAQLPDLLAAVTPERLSPSVKGKLLEKLEKSPVPTAAEPAERPQGRWWPPPRSKRRIWQLATAVSAILILLFLVWNIQLNVALARERALRAEVADIVGQQELILEVIDSEQTERLVLLPLSGASDAYGKVFTRSDMPHVVAMAARLLRPPAGHAYHLWLSRGTETKLAGLMAVDDDGFGMLIYQAEQEGPTYDAAALTLQPLGAVEPKGEPLLVWSREQ